MPGDELSPERGETPAGNDPSSGSSLPAARARAVIGGFFALLVRRRNDEGSHVGCLRRIEGCEYQRVGVTKVERSPSGDSTSTNMGVLEAGR